MESIFASVVGLTQVVDQVESGRSANAARILATSGHIGLALVNSSVEVLSTLAGEVGFDAIRALVVACTQVVDQVKAIGFR